MERALSNYVKRHLEQDLKERGIVVNREVEIRQKEGGEGAATGEIPDLYVSAVSQNSDGNEMKQLVVLIEVKGNWHDELKTAIQTQLVERYLHNNDRATCGLYLVGWFNCQQWDHTEISLSNPVIFPSQNRNFSTVRHPHFDMLVVSVKSTGKPDAQPAFAPISAPFSHRVILTGSLSKLTG
jgi:hypothetical protein